MTPASATAIRGPHTAGSAYTTLRRLILRGEFAPGEQLTGERLSKMLGVSRTPVRHALVRLEADGLVETAPGQPARVRLITASEVEQAYDAAGGLEGILVYRLAEASAPAQLGEISDAVADMERAADCGDSDAWAEADERFHSLLSQYGSNRLIAQMLARVETIVGQLRYFVLYTGATSMMTSAHEHHAVLNAIEQHDPDRARQVHQAHWARVREVNAHFLRENLSRMRRYL